MIEIVSTEIKGDLENIYKISSDMIVSIDSTVISTEGNDTRKLISDIRFQLESISGTLQKDIYNCDYLITQSKIKNEELK